MSCFSVYTCMIDLKLNNIVLRFSVKHVCSEGTELMTTN